MKVIYSGLPTISTMIFPLLSLVWYLIWTVTKAYLILDIARFICSVSKAIFIYRIWPKFKSPHFGDKKGWALVTGCTDGVGKALVDEFLRNGVKTILVSRSGEKLKCQADELAKLYPNVETKILQFDFTQTDYSQLAEQLKSVQVDILVNNVGIGPNVIVKFLEKFNYLNEEIVRVNFLSCQRMTELVLPQMIANNFGRIVNVSSAVGLYPFAYISSYGATKNAVINYSRALSSHKQLKSRNVYVTCLYPNLIATKLSQYDMANLYVVDRRTYAKEVVGTIGLISETSGCFQHDIQIAIAYLTPNWVFDFLSEVIAKLESYRTTKLKKMQMNDKIINNIKNNNHKTK